MYVFISIWYKCEYLFHVNKNWDLGLLWDPGYWEVQALTVCIFGLCQYCKVNLLYPIIVLILVTYMHNIYVYIMPIFKRRTSDKSPLTNLK